MKGLPAPKVSPQTIVNNQIVAAVINQELHPAYTTHVVACGMHARDPCCSWRPSRKKWSIMRCRIDCQCKGLVCICHICTYMYSFGMCVAYIYILCIKREKHKLVRCPLNFGACSDGGVFPNIGRDSHSPWRWTARPNSQGSEESLGSQGWHFQIQATILSWRWFPSDPGWWSSWSSSSEDPAGGLGILANWRWSFAENDLCI